jgi:post-segregation antitoxin (ccd killing protein)
MVQIVSVDLYLTNGALRVCQDHGLDVSRICRDSVQEAIRNRAEIDSTILKLRG